MPPLRHITLRRLHAVAAAYFDAYYMLTTTPIDAIRRDIYYDTLRCH